MNAIIFSLFITLLGLAILVQGCTSTSDEEVRKSRAGGEVRTTTTTETTISITLDQATTKIEWTLDAKMITDDVSSFKATMNLIDEESSSDAVPCSKISAPPPHVRCTLDAKDGYQPGGQYILRIAAYSILGEELDDVWSISTGVVVPVVQGEVKWTTTIHVTHEPNVVDVVWKMGNKLEPQEIRDFVIKVKGADWNGQEIFGVCNQWYCTRHVLKDFTLKRGHYTVTIAPRNLEQEPLLSMLTTAGFVVN